MIKQIIKRNGSIEEFIPSKVNRWLEWTTKGLEGRAEWSSIVLETIKNLSGTITSEDLQKALIKTCLLKRDWPHNLMAGRLYVAILRNSLYDKKIPSVKELQKKLIDMGLMEDLGYTDEEYLEVGKIIDHSKDFTYAHFQLHQVVKKYSIQDRVKKESYETPQFTYMRMAMALAKNDKENKLLNVSKFYKYFSDSIINAPTPNYVNLGTPLHGYASCCLYTTGDNAQSLAIGDHIAYTMTYMSAGIGSNINCRSINDSVKNGAIQHSGKFPYFRSLAGAVKANLQSGRGGACTTYFSLFDKEAPKIIVAYNPRTPVASQIRDIHFAAISNRLFARKVAKNEDIFFFNTYTAPDLMEKFYSGDQDGFEELYNKYLNDDNFKKEFYNARELLLLSGKESYNVSVHYHFNVDEANRHTPFLEPIYSSNLCLEVTEPTKPYYDMKDLYSIEDHGRGEVALCNLAGINVAAKMTDDEYFEAAYFALKMIDETIHLGYYQLPHIGFTAKQRLNAGVGIIGFATYLAELNLKYDSKEGRQAAHAVGERHMYFLIKASLKLAKEKGVAPWMHKTKWPQGWLPIDTYKKAVDELADPIYNYDWESLRKEIIDNGGIRNSVLVAHMPTESSSKASGVPNGIYPVRDFFLKKTDQKNVVDWCPKDGDILGEQYQLAYNIDTIDMIKMYAVFQKWTDQSISADFYKDRTKKIEISDREIINEYLAMIKYGVKSRYYQNTLTSKAKEEIEEPNIDVVPIEVTEQKDEYGYGDTSNEKGCAGGTCTL